MLLQHQTLTNKIFQWINVKLHSIRPSFDDSGIKQDSENREKERYESTEDVVEIQGECVDQNLQKTSYIGSEEKKANDQQEKLVYLSQPAVKQASLFKLELDHFVGIKLVTDICILEFWVKN